MPSVDRANGAPCQEENFAIDVRRRLTAASEQYVGNFFSNPSTAETALQSPSTLYA
jgi:hypothetical protein